MVEDKAKELEEKATDIKETVEEKVAEMKEAIEEKAAEVVDDGNRIPAGLRCREGWNGHTKKHAYCQSGGSKGTEGFPSLGRKHRPVIISFVLEHSSSPPCDD